MSTRKVSVAGAARRIASEDKRVRRAMAKDAKTKSQVADSFVNFGQKLGIGADNALSTASYGFNPITRNRVMLEWIHRGSWLGGVAVDVVAEDMCRAGIDLQTTLKPDQMQKIEEAAVTLGVWKRIQETIQWGRLYGGCIGVFMVDGQRPDTPLRIDTIGRGQFKGLLVLDRWMVEPSLNDLITEPGPNLGLPKFYTVIADAPALPRMKIHHSRCFRQEGVTLPYWQRVQEMLWGTSVLERLYDRMVAFDSASTGAAQLVYKAFIRTYKIDGMREIVAAGGKALDGLVRYVEMMRRFQGIEGITLLDGKDEFAVREHGTFAGLSDALVQFGQQLSGALQIPLVRLFGQSPAGFNSGDSDLRNYYDGINKKQETELRVPVTKVYRCISQSEGIKLPDGFRTEFRPLWQLTPDQKADVAVKTTDAVTKAEEAGLISQHTGMKELRQASRQTGVFTNITDEDIEAAETTLPPAGEEALGAVGGIAIGTEGADKDNPQPGGNGEKPAQKAAADGQFRRGQVLTHDGKPVMFLYYHTRNADRAFVRIQGRQQMVELRDLSAQ